MGIVSLTLYIRVKYSLVAAWVMTGCALMYSLYVEIQGRASKGKATR